MSYFDDLIDTEARKAIPNNWRFIPTEKLLGRFPYKIKLAFNSSNIQGKSKLINILSLHSKFPLNQGVENKIINLRNYILSKNCILFVICEQEDARYLNDVGIFESERLKVDSPNYFSVSCYQDQNYKTTIDGSHYEELNEVIHDIWSGSLRYYGVKKGIQKVNLEIMKDECWRCNQLMETVTGLVFPNRPLESWDNPDWQYYNDLLPLSSIRKETAQIIQKMVNQLRKENESITPVEYKYSNTTKSRYWAATCPHCHSLRGDFHITDYRTQYLFNLESRSNGNLKYYPIELNVDLNLIQVLGQGFENSPHACFMGWKRN